MDNLVAKWPHSFSLYIHEDFLICYRHACRDMGSEKPAGRGCTCVQFLSGLL